MSTTSHTTPTPGADEQWVREVIDSAMSGSRPPQELTDAALARGRRLRARRRAGAAGAVVAASVLAAVAVPWALGGQDGRATGGGDLVATQPPAPDQPPAPEGYWDMPARTMVEELTELLPDGVIMVNTGRLDLVPSSAGRASGTLNSTLGTDMGGEIVTGNVNLMTWADAAGVAALEGVGGHETTFTVGPTDTLACPGNLIDPVTCTQVLDGNGRIVGPPQRLPAGRGAGPGVRPLRGRRVRLRRDGEHRRVEVVGRLRGHRTASAPDDGRARGDRPRRRLDVLRGPSSLMRPPAGRAVLDPLDRPAW